MACTNLVGWAGYRWGCVPDWGTTGVIRPVTEIKRSVSICVNDLPSQWAHPLFVDVAFADQPTEGAVGLSAAVVDLAGGKPAIRHRQHRAVTGCLVSQLRLDGTHCGIGHGPPQRPASHTAFHGGHVEVFDHEVAIGARQFGGELVGGFPTQVHAPTIQSGQLGFRCPVAARSGDAAGKLSTGPLARRQRRLQRAGFGYSMMFCAPVAVSTAATVAKVRTPKSIPARTVGQVSASVVSGVRNA
jgi:hypothetical protein